MIKTVSDLLQKIIEKEEEVLNNYNLEHPGMIGDMYEGLTKNLLEKAMPENLHVVSGVIVDDKENVSAQIDCMICYGDGEQIPFTKNYKYKLSNVIAVIEVKKNLFSKDLKSAYLNLKSVQELDDSRMIDIEPIRYLFRKVYKEDLPDKNKIKDLNIDRQLFFHNTVLEYSYPVRIILGYNGFASEFSLRNKFVEFLKEKISTKSEIKKGFGITSFPTLIICNNYSLIKLNGFPYTPQIDSDGFILSYASSSDNPMIFLLEYVWTKLVNLFDLPNDVFGEDLNNEKIIPFLSARVIDFHGNPGWEYKPYYLKRTEFEDYLEKYDAMSSEEKEWSPAILSIDIYLVFQKLRLNGEINYIELANEIKCDPIKLKKELLETNLVYLDGDLIKLSTEKCATAILPDGRFVAGENATGKFARWIEKKNK